MKQFYISQLSFNMVKTVLGGVNKVERYPVHIRFIFLFVLFENIGELASEATAEREREKFFFPHRYPFTLAVNKSPAVYILSPALDRLWRENRVSVNRLVEHGLFNYSLDRVSPIKKSLYEVYVSSFLPYRGREFLRWFKIISLISDWYLKENFNRSDRLGEFKLLLTTGDSQPSFVTLVQKRGQFSLRSVGLPFDALILAFIMTCLIVGLLEG